MATAKSDTKDTLNRAKRPESPKGEPKPPKGEKLAGMGPGDEGQHVKEAAKKEPKDAFEVVMQRLDKIDARLDAIELLVGVVREDLERSSLGFRRLLLKAGVER